MVGFAPSFPLFMMFVVTAGILAHPRRPWKVASLQLSTCLLGAVDVVPLLLFSSSAARSGEDSVLFFP